MHHSPRSPLNFPISCLDDLLIWADLWEDAGEPEYARACRWIHTNGKLPRKYRFSKKDKVQFRWNIYYSVGFKENRWELSTSISGFLCDVSSDTSRSYASLTLAYLDLLNHMVAAGLPLP